MAFPVDVALERRDGAFGERQLRVGDDFLPVEADDAAETATVRAGPDRGIEGEQRRRGGTEAPAIDRRFEDFAEAANFDAGVRQQAHAAAAEPEGHQGSLMEARGFRGRNGQAILDDEDFIGVLGNGFFAQPDPLAGHESPGEAGAHKLFGDGWPS